MIEYYDGDIPDPRGRDAVRSGPLYEAGFILYSVVTDALKPEYVELINEGYANIDCIGNKMTVKLTYKGTEFVEKRHMKLHCEHEYKYDGSLPHGSSPDCYKCSKCGNTFFD